MSLIRSVASFLCWVVAVVAAVVTIPTFWLATHLADEEGFVDFTRPFVADAELRNALVDQIAKEVVLEVDLPAAAEPGVRVALRRVAAQTARQPGFVDAWDESQRRTHRLTFGPDAKTDRLTADIGPIAAFVVQRVTQDIPVRVRVPETLLVPIYDAPDRAVLEQVDKTTNRSRIGILVVALASLLCVVLARRRGTAIAGLGAGAVLAAGLLLAGTRVALPEVLDRTPAGTPFARQMRDLLVDRASDSLNEWLVGIAVVGGVVLVIGALGRALPRR